MDIIIRFKIILNKSKEQITKIKRKKQKLEKNSKVLESQIEYLEDSLNENNDKQLKTGIILIFIIAIFRYFNVYDFILELMNAKKEFLETKGNTLE